MFDNIPKDAIQVDKSDSKLGCSGMRSLMDSLLREPLGKYPTIKTLNMYVSAYQAMWYSYLLGELLDKYHKTETIKTLNIYISAYQAIIRS